MLLLQGLHCNASHLRSITVVQGPQWGMLGVLSAVRVENETPPPNYTYDMRSCRVVTTINLAVSL